MAQSKDKCILLTPNTHSWQEAVFASCFRYAVIHMKHFSGLRREAR